MTDKEKQLKQLYEDALYWWFINKGYSNSQAKVKANQLIHKM